MNITQKIITRQSLALFSSILILLNSTLVACGPNQSLPQLMKSSLAGSVSDDGSGSDDRSGDDDSGDDEEGPGTVSEPEPSEPSNGGDSGSTGTTVDSPGPSEGTVTIDNQGGGKTVTKVDFNFPGKTKDNEGRDTTQDKDAERSVGSDKSVSISEDTGEPTGSRSDSMPEGSPALGNSEGLGSGSGGKANDGGSSGPGGSPKSKETKKFPNLPAFVGDTDGVDGSMDKTIRDANALFDGSKPDLNKQIGLGVTSHNNAVAAVFVGVALVALPALSIPAWAIAGAAAVAIAAIIANSTIDWGSIDRLFSRSDDSDRDRLQGEYEKMADDSAGKSPVGRRGSPIDVKPGTNKPETIKGRKYSGHALDQMQGRGVPPTAVQEAIDNGTKSPSRGGTTIHTDNTNGVTVITNENGDVVTVITSGK
jgi:hypothetical protein